jgi:hypothetical protein
MWEDFWLHYGFSSVVYTLAIVLTVSNKWQWWWVLLAIVLHFGFTGLQLLRMFEISAPLRGVLKEFCQDFARDEKVNFIIKQINRRQLEDLLKPIQIKT